MAKCGLSSQKGRKATPIIFYKNLVLDDPEALDANEDGQVKRPMARSYSVFAAEQVLDADGQPHPRIDRRGSSLDHAENGDAYLASAGLHISTPGAVLRRAFLHGFA